MNCGDLVIDVFSHNDLCWNFEFDVANIFDKMLLLLLFCIICMTVMLTSGNNLQRRKWKVIETRRSDEVG